MSDTVVVAAFVAVANVISNAIGFRAVARDLGDKLKNKIDVAEYREKVAVLHAEINALKLENNSLKADVRHLQERK